MKELIFTVFATFLFSIPGVSAELDSADRDAITKRVVTIQNAVNKSDANAVLDILSPKASEMLKQEIQDAIRGQNVKYQQNVSVIEEIGFGKVRVTGKFAAEGVNWNVSGLSNYFVFEEMEDAWYLLESDFQGKLNPKYVTKFVGKIFMFVIPALLFFTAFWIWMIVDVAKRSIANKTMWVLIVVLLGFFGAILYFFIARRKHIKSLKQED